MAIDTDFFNNLALFNAGAAKAEERQLKIDSAKQTLTNTDERAKLEFEQSKLNIRKSRGQFDPAFLDLEDKKARAELTFKQTEIKQQQLENEQLGIQNRQAMQENEVRRKAFVQQGLLDEAIGGSGLRAEVDKFNAQRAQTGLPPLFGKEAQGQPQAQPQAPRGRQQDITTTLPAGGGVSVKISTVKEKERLRRKVSQVGVAGLETGERESFFGTTRERLFSKKARGETFTAEEQIVFDLVSRPSDFQLLTRALGTGLTDTEILKQQQIGTAESGIDDPRFKEAVADLRKQGVSDKEIRVRIAEANKVVSGS